METMRKFVETFGNHGGKSAADIRRENPELADRMAAFIRDNKRAMVREVSRLVPRDDREGVSNG